MLYIIFPVFNEDRNIVRVIREARKKLARLPHKIIVVDDGSTDSTYDQLRRISRYSDVTVEHYHVNMGVGCVFATGIHRVLSQAKDTDTMVIMESDGTSDMAILPMILREISGGSEIAIASRYSPGGRYEHFPWQRMVYSSVVNWLLKYMFPISGVLDYTIFYRAYRVGIVREATRYFGEFGLIQSRGFVANAELLIKLSLFHPRIAEVPFVYNYARKRGSSKIDVLRTINEYFVVVTYLRQMQHALGRAKLPTSRSYRSVKTRIPSFS